MAIYDQIHFPQGRKFSKCKWFYRAKYVSSGSVDKHMDQLVTKIFSWEEGIEYSKTFLVITKMISIPLVISLEAS
jgi:hypothetical protein